MSHWAWDELKEDNEWEKKIDFTKEHQTFCTGIDIHNVLLFSWQKLFIDIRPDNEYKKSHIKQFINIPINSNEQTVIKTFKDNFDGMNHYKCIHIYCCANKNIISNKLDIKWYEYIQQILCKHFIVENDEENEDPKGYKFGTFNLLNIDYEIFEYKYKHLINIDNSKGNNMVKQYPNIIIENKLYLGDSDDAYNKQIIIDYGITHILNVSFECDNEFEDDEDLNIKYLQIELSDSPNSNISDRFNECIEFIENAFNEKDGNNNNIVLCHCFAGVSRSSSVIIAYLIKMRNMKYEEAFKFVKHKRSIICPNEGFVEQLKIWGNAGCGKQMKMITFDKL